MIIPRTLPAWPGFTILLLSLLPAIARADWPCFQGPTRDGRLDPADARSLDFGKKAVLRWKVPVGKGFSGPVLVGERVLQFQREGDREVLRAHDLATGEKKWERDHVASYRDDFGFDPGPRATPAIAGGRVFTLGAAGILAATDLESGRPLWQVDTRAKFEVRKGFFGTAASPLVVGDRVIVIVGGQAENSSVVAFGVEDAEVRWSSGSHEASYSSPVLARLGEHERILAFTREGLLGLDPASGKIHLEHPWRPRINASVNAATPLVVEDSVWISTSYGKGAVLLEPTRDGPVERWKSNDALTCHYSTPVLSKGVLYGHHGRQEYSPSFRAVRASDGRVLWDRPRFGAGTVSLAGDRLLVLQETGTLHVLAVRPERFESLGKFPLFEGTVRAYPAFGPGVVVARDENELRVWTWK